MENIPKDVFELDKNKNIALQVLQLSGWTADRRINIDLIEQRYKESGYLLDKFSKNIIAEFYELKQYCYFILIDKYGNKYTGGYDFGFETSGAFNIRSEYELKQIPEVLRKTAVPIMSVGFHMPGTVWAVNETLYHTFSYRNDLMKTYKTVFELLEHELQFKYEKVYLTFKHSCPWIWETIKKQNEEIRSSRHPC